MTENSPISFDPDDDMSGCLSKICLLLAAAILAAGLFLGSGARDGQSSGDTEAKEGIQ